MLHASKDSIDETATPVSVTGKIGGETAVASTGHKDGSENVSLNYLRKILFFGMIIGAVIIYINTRKAQSKAFNYKSLA